MRIRNENVQEKLIFNKNGLNYSHVIIIKNGFMIKHSLRVLTLVRNGIQATFYKHKTNIKMQDYLRAGNS